MRCVNYPATDQPSCIISPSLQDLSGSLDDLPTGCDFNSQSSTSSGGAAAATTTGSAAGNSSSHATANTSSSSTNHSGSGGSSTSTAPPLSPATSVHSVHSPHVHPSVTALRPSPSPVGSPSSHLSRSSQSPASVHGGSMTPQPSQPPSNTPEAPSQTPPSASADSRGYNQHGMNCGNSSGTGGSAQKPPPYNSQQGPASKLPSQNPSGGMGGGPPQYWGYQGQGGAGGTAGGYYNQNMSHYNQQGNYGRQTGPQGYGGHHGNVPSSAPNNSGNMSYEQRMRNNSSGSSGGGSGMNMENNSQHSGYNSSNMPNASHGMGANNQSGPNNMSPNVARGGPGMSPTYGYGPNAQGQIHRTDNMGSGPSPGLSPGPSPGPGGVGVGGGAQAAAAAAVAAAAASSAHLSKRNQYPLNQQMQGQQPPPPLPNQQQGSFPQSFPQQQQQQQQQQQWNQQSFRQHQQYSQGNGPPFSGGVPPTSADQTNFNQMPSSVPNDAMHGYMHPSSGNQMPPHTAATTIANTNSGSNSTSVTQSITTPVASSVSSLTPSTASESSRDAGTPGTPHSIIKEENVLSRPPSVHSRPSPLASPGAMSKSSQEDMANTPSPGMGMQQASGPGHPPQPHQPPPPYPGMYHQQHQSLPHPQHHPPQHMQQQHHPHQQQHHPGQQPPTPQHPGQQPPTPQQPGQQPPTPQHPGQQPPTPQHPGQHPPPQHPGQQPPYSQQPPTPQQQQGAAAPVTPQPAPTPKTTASSTTTTTTSKSKKGQSQEPASKLTSLNLPKKLYKLYELCPHPERRAFLDRLFKLMEDRGQPIRTMPQISSHVLDLFKLYNTVKDRGGVIKVSKSKQWKQIAIEISVGNSNSAAFTLKKNYIRHLLAYECLFDRGGIDPQQILAEIDTTSTKKSKDSSSAAAAAAAAMNHHPNPSDPYSQFGPQGGKPGFPPMPNQMHGYGPPSMYGNNMGPMGPHMAPRPNMPNSNVPGNMHPGGPGGDMTANSVMVCDPFSDMDYQHGGQQQQQQQGPYPGQNAMNGSFPPNSHAAMNHQFNRNNMGGGPPSGPGASGGGNNMPFGGPPGPGESDPYSMPNRNMPCNDPYAMNSYTRRGNVDPYSGGGGGGGGGGGAGAGQGSGPMNQANAGQYAGGNHPPGAPNFDQNRYSASPTTHMTPSPNQGPPSSGQMPPFSSSSTPDPQQQPPFTSRFGSSSRPTTPSDSHTSASSSPFLPPPYSAAGPSPAKQSQGQQPPAMSQASPSVPPSQPAQSQQQQQMPQKPPTPTPTPPKGQTPPQPSPQSGPTSQPSGPPAPGQQQSQSGGVPPSSQPPPQSFGNDPMRMNFPQKRPSDVFPPPPKRPDFMGPGQHTGDGSHGSGPGFHGMPPYSSQQGNFSQGGYGSSDRPMGPSSFPPVYNDRQQSPHPPHGPALGNPVNSYHPPFFNEPGPWPASSSGMDGPPMDMYNQRHAPTPSPRNIPGPGPPMREPGWLNSNYPFPSDQGAKRDGIPPEGYGKGMPPPPASSHSGLGPSPSWGSVQQRPPASMMNQSPFTGARTLHSVLTQGMPPRGSSHHPHPISSMQGMKPPHKPQQPVYASSQQKKEMTFPPDSVEATQPIIVKTKRKTSKDIGAVEAWKLMMSLKSGLLAETTWALEVLSVLLFDHHTVMYFDLKQMKGLLEIVCEHYRALLIEMFGCFEDLEIRTKSQLERRIQSSKTEVKEEIKEEVQDEESDEEKLEDNVVENDVDINGECTNDKTEAELLAEAADCADVERLRGVDKTKPIKFDGVQSGYFCNQQEWDVHEGFDAGSLHWQEGGGEMTKHILRVFERIESDEDKENSDARRTTIEWLRHCSEELKAIRDFDVVEEEKHVIYVSESQKKKGEVVLEDEEQFVNDTPSLVTTSDMQNAFGQRCVCVSNIIRSLSFIPGNDLEMAKHPGLITVLSRILLLHHSHPRRKELPQTYDRDDQEDLDLECPITNSHRWWCEHLECMRENALVTITNLGGVLDMSKYVESVTLPMLDGLLHWAVCVSACALDPFPTMSSDSPLTPQRLAIEALAKLSIQENNVDMILATPPFHRLERLYATLTQYLGERSDPVMRELSLVLLSNIARSDMTASRAIATKNSVVSFLLRYIEDSEYTMSCEKNSPHMINPDLAKPSHDMMRRAADALASLARVPTNKALFLQHQNRLLNLSMSPLLDSEVKERVASALFELAL
ncbi:AT-rich interactive domain-containing protein 1A-like [Lytechinus pictus]|uniref:AT-rich interactive domain-containing protein 1A-like n=1 Tax=Lytechinus pictus TaxID=7653 RepID=UPI0030BA2545